MHLGNSQKTVHSYNKTRESDYSQEYRVLRSYSKVVTKKL